MFAGNAAPARALGCANILRSCHIAAHLSIAWLLTTWWAHDSLHIHNGMYLNGLLGIEYGFHFTLITSGLMLARFFLAIVRVPATSSP